MFENLFKKRKFNVKDLYVAYPAIVTRAENGDIVINQEEKAIEPIIVKKINELYVQDVLSERKYGIFTSSYSFVREFLNQYMVMNNLMPLELSIKNKTNITRQEIINMLYSASNANEVDEEEKEETIEEEIKDSVLQEILRVSNSLEENSVSESEKERIRNELKQLGAYYVNGLIELKSRKGEITLSFKNELGLKKECMRLLTIIEEKIPIDNHESFLRKQLSLFETKIGK